MGITEDLRFAAAKLLRLGKSAVDSAVHDSLSGVSENVASELLHLTGFQGGEFPFRYLGIPLTSTKLKISEFCPLLDKLSSKICAWPKNTLSYVGRLELIRSVIQGTHCYWMSIIPFPEGVIKKIYSICRSFFWNSKHPAIAWKMVCKPYAFGGLGLRNLSSWNKALLCKILWNIHSKKDSLWIKWINHYYTKDIMSYCARSDDSFLMKSLLKIRTDLLANGESIADVSKRMQLWFEGSTSSMELPYMWLSNKEGNWPWKPLICKQGIMPKHKISLWLFAHRKFLTRDRQSYVIEKKCVLCEQKDESFNHLFFECDITKELWRQIRNTLGIKKIMGSANTLLHAFRGVYRGSSWVNKFRLATTAATIYHIWDMRNRKIFENESPNLEFVLRKIQICMLRLHHMSSRIQLDNVP